MNTILNKSYVDTLFDTSTHQAEIIIGLYKGVVPNWDSVVKMNCYPECSDFAWNYICQKFFDFDRLHHPDVIAGGAWLNHGFSMDKNLTGWNVSVNVSEIEYKN